MGLKDQLVFLKQFWTNYHTTGAILPSGKGVGRALSHFVRNPDDPRPGRRILEVGPGTGAVTRQILAGLRPGDRLSLVELNDQFVARLQDLFAHDPAFQPLAAQTNILHQAVETLPQGETYDLIISGLPLNNFEVATVETILSALRRLLAPGGVLSFFEYIWIRPMRGLVSTGEGRKRLQGIGRLLDEMTDNHEIRRDRIMLNVPPAWVHHVQLTK